MKKVYKPEAVYCPRCGAWQHPYTEEGDTSEALYCKACKQDMTPAIKAMKQYMKDFVNLIKGEKVERITDEDVNS